MKEHKWCSLLNSLAYKVGSIGTPAGRGPRNLTSKVNEAIFQVINRNRTMFGAVRFTIIYDELAPGSETLNVITQKAEVDAVMEQAKNAGGVIVKPAHDAFWGGYTGYFQDPDQHLWEVAWNPEWVAQE